MRKKKLEMVKSFLPRYFTVIDFDALALCKKINDKIIFFSFCDTTGNSFLLWVWNVCNISFRLAIYLLLLPSTAPFHAELFSLSYCHKQRNRVHSAVLMKFILIRTYNWCRVSSVQALASLVMPCVCNRTNWSRNMMMTMASRVVHNTFHNKIIAWLLWINETKKKNFFCLFYYAKDIIAIIIIVESRVERVCKNRRKWPALE